MPTSSPAQLKHSIPWALWCVSSWQVSAEPLWRICAKMKRVASPKVTPPSQGTPDPMTEWHWDTKAEPLAPTQDEPEWLSQLQFSKICCSFTGNWYAIQPLPLPNPASFTPYRYWSGENSCTQICLSVCCLGKWLMTLAHSQRANERSKWDLLQMCQHNSTIIKCTEETKWMNEPKDLYSNIVNNNLKHSNNALWIRIKMKVSWNETGQLHP